MVRTLIATCIFLLSCVLGSSCMQNKEPPPTTVKPSLQPSPGLVVFTSTRDNGGGTIYSIKSDGTELTRVTPPNLIAGFPRWMPGCEKIAFSAIDGIYLVNPDGSGLERLVTIPDFGIGFLSWSPGAEQMVFNMADQNLPRGRNVWIVNSDGSGKQQLTHCPISCSAPIWHPNGYDIFYFYAENDYTTAPTRYSLNRTDVLGTQHEVWLPASETSDLSSGSIPSISPDGTKFVVAKEVDEEEHTDIFVLDIRSREWQRLTNDQAYHDQPAWSPDSGQIVFVSYQIPKTQTTRSMPSVSGIWIMNADGSGRFQVVEPEGKNLEPDWCSP